MNKLYLLQICKKNWSFVSKKKIKSKYFCCLPSNGVNIDFFNNLERFVRLLKYGLNIETTNMITNSTIQ